MRVKLGNQWFMELLIKFPAIFLTNVEIPVGIGV